MTPPHLNQCLCPCILKVAMKFLLKQTGAEFYFSQVLHMTIVTFAIVLLKIIFASSIVM